MTQPNPNLPTRKHGVTSSFGSKFGRDKRTDPQDGPRIALYDIRKMHKRRDEVLAARKSAHHHGDIPPKTHKPWMLVCETHKTSSRYGTKPKAEAAMDDPAAWCLGCESGRSFSRMEELK